MIKGLIQLFSIKKTNQQKQHNLKSKLNAAVSENYDDYFQETNTESESVAKLSSHSNAA